ncbi:transketolase [Suicoccus acidiformans]|uniref:Transketolase n=1 Tax=Suicoccus acidiformans TaxID=2036206 RepID=A0A347WIT9_9LACT|nr:transketolase [Suicoccus acidiformans]AXY24996.1 transketolase [Suicoccus acidiformans]
MNIKQESILTIRNLILDSVEYAKHGHMGMPLGSASMGYELFRNHMNHNPKNPNWFNRDRFILTSGHGSILQYVLLHLSGYDVTLDDLKTFRKNNSNTPGHPEVGETAGVEATTGPLGQGFSLTVGMAIAEAHLSARFNREGYDVIDHYTYTICGDGDLQEGVALEAAQIAGNLGLGKLIVLYDSNDVTSDGPIGVSSTIDTQQLFQAMNWQTLYVEDGNNPDEVGKAIEVAKSEPNKPTLIEVKNIIGFGSTFQGTSNIHSDPVGLEEAKIIKKNLGWDKEDFYVSNEVSDHFEEISDKGAKAETQWDKLMESYKVAHPELFNELEKMMNGKINVSEEVTADFQEEKLATRSASGEVLNRIYKELPILVGGSADLASSNKTEIKNYPYMELGQFEGPNIHFGVREFAMASIVTGITLHGGLKGYSGTFMVFSDYMRSALRLAALMGTPVIFIFTHDSLMLGQDGPTHQPIEHLASLRAMPNIVVYRGADANEVSVGWKLAMESKDRPFILSLGRHEVPVLNNISKEDAAKGAYVLSKDSETPELILIATGSEVETAFKVKDSLKQTGKFDSINLVSMPSWELFEEQEQSYKDAVLNPNVKNRVSIELGSTQGWKKYVGEGGLSIGINHFGKSAPAVDLLEDYRLTPEHIVDTISDYYSN